MPELGGCGFILRDLHEPAPAENPMLRPMVRDADAWWAAADPAAALAEAPGAEPPRPPAAPSWGLKAGFGFDPSGVMRHGRGRCPDAAARV